MAIQKKKVLVVDPSATSRKSLMIRLEVMDVEVREAATAEEVRSLAKDDKFDTVITEWTLPGLQGGELIGALKPVAGPACPVILYTDRDPQELPPVEELGIAAVFSKKRRPDLLKQLEGMFLAREEAPLPPGAAVGRHILVIEDSEMIRRFIRRALEGAFPDCALREAGDGKAAISEMSQKKVDLIITDLEMPGMDGVTFLRLVRRNPVLKLKPILVLSGSITKDLTREFEADNRMQFLPKPSNADTIVETARRLLNLDSLQSFKNMV